MINRRDVIRKTGAVTAGAALAGGTLPIAGLGTAAILAQDTEFDVWSTWTDEIHATIVDGIGTTFAEANGVTFSHRAWTLEELMDTLPRSVDSDQGPDVSMINNGESQMGPMARGGQISSLAEYDAQFGWSERFAPSLLARCSYTADGATFGEGELWGLPAESEIVGFFYNKEIFSKNGLSVPTTVAEFEGVLSALKDAGVPPLVFGNLDKWQAIHLFGEVQGTNTTREYLDGLIYRRGDQSFDDPSIISAAQRLIDWKDAGYFMNGFDGVTADDAQAVFVSGGGGVLLQGSWATGAVKEGLGENAGFFLMPPLEASPSATPSALPVATPVASAPVLHVGGVGIPFGITANAADPAVAANFLDALVSPEAFDAFISKGLLPIGEIAQDKIVEGTVDGDLYTAWNTALAADAVGHYLDWAAPEFFDVLTGALQELLGGQVTAEEFAGKLQEFYAASFA